jgi:hypothetical protein
MKAFRIAGVITLNLLTLQAEDLSLRYLGIGPINLHTTLTHEGQGERLTATAKNESGVVIQHAKICIHSFDLPESLCLFELSNTAPWLPGGEVNWNITTDRKAAGLRHFATIEQFESERTSEATPTISYLSPRVSRGPTLTIQDGTPVRMRLAQNLSSSEARTGDTVNFEVLDDVKVENSVVIRGGATAIATITDSESKRSMGRAGRLDVSLDYVRSVFGEKIRVRGVQNNKAGGHTGAMTGAMVATAVVFWPAAPLFLFMKGKDVKIPKGHEVTVYVNGDQQVQGLLADVIEGQATVTPIPAEKSEKSTARPAFAGKPMTNDDVVTLKAAGFGDDFIVSKIKAATPGFSLDTPDLVKLKQAGLSDAVVGAMVQAQGSPTVSPLATIDQGFEEPELGGIFYALDGPKLIPLERRDAVVQVGVSGIIVMNGKSVIKFTGPHSPVRLRHAPSLDFIVRSSANADPGTLYHLRRLEISKTDREITVMSEHATPLGASAKVDDQSIVPLEYSRYGTHSVKVTAALLSPGEYAIGSQGGKTIFCFGVD